MTARPSLENCPALAFGIPLTKTRQQNTAGALGCELVCEADLLTVS
jgi:hypothetical protein